MGSVLNYQSLVKYKWPVTAFILTLILIFLDRFQVVSPYIMFVLMVGLCNVILTLSLNLITGITGQFSLGHAGFMAVGAYISAFLTKAVFHLKPGAGFFSGTVLFLLSLMIGALAAAVIAFFLGLIILRLTGDYLCIATLGFNQIVVVALNNLDFLGGPRGFYGIPKLSNLWSLIFLAWISVVFISRYIHSSRGRNCEAILGDEIAAESLGIDSLKVKLHALVIGCFFAALAGGMLVHLIQLAHPTQYTFIKSIEILLMVVVGGMGSIVGSVIAGIGLTVLPELLRFSQDLRLILYPLLLIIFISRDPLKYLQRRFFLWCTRTGGE